MPEFGRLPPDYLSVKVGAGTLSRMDADLILRFVNAEAARVGHREHTVLSNTRYLAHLVEHTPDIPTWTNDKINQYVQDARKGAANTSRKRIILTKQFCEWLVQTDINTTLKLDGIKVIKATPANRMTKTSAMMLSTDQIDKIVAAGKNTRDRCMLSVLSESGMRPFECLGLKWGELKIDEFGIVLNVAGKTGVPRFIRLVHAAPHVAAWKNDCPFKEDGAFIFTSLKDPRPDLRITHSALKKVLRIAVRKAGIKKPVFPYLFRHSSVTRMLEEGYSDSTIRMVHWGSQTTSMLGSYGHVSKQAIDKEILGMAGITDLKKKERKTVNQCPSCQNILLPTSDFCPKCGHPITDSAVQKIVSINNVLDAEPTEADFIEAAKEMYARRKAQKV